MATPPPNPVYPDPRAQRRAAREQARLRAVAQSPSSLLGPVLLVVLGIAFLVAEINHISFGSLFGLLVRWAPLLLILLGATLLVEWIFDRRRSEAARLAGLPYVPMHRSSAWGLLLAFLLIFSLVGRVSGHARDADSPLSLLSDRHQGWGELFGQRHESTSTLDHPCPPGTNLNVSLPHGDLTITGNSTDGQLHASVHSVIFSTSDSDAARRASALTPVIHDEGGTLSISVPFREGVQVDLALSVPSTVLLHAQTDHGDLSISGMNTPTSLIANHGDVTLNTINSPVEIHLNNSDSSLTMHELHGPIAISGRVEDLVASQLTGPVRFDGDIFGDMHLEHVAGPTHLHTSRLDLQFLNLSGTLESESDGTLTLTGAEGPVTLNARNRNIEIERVLGPLVISNQNGSIEASLLSPLSPVSISNRNGKVDVTLPASAPFTLDASTSDASLNNDFGLQSSTEGNQVRVSGPIAGGGVPIRIQTSNSDLDIHKAENTSSTIHLPPIPAIPSIPGHLSRHAQSHSSDSDDADDDASDDTDGGSHSSGGKHKSGSTVAF